MVLNVNIWSVGFVKGVEGRLSGERDHFHAGRQDQAVDAVGCETGDDGEALGLRHGVVALEGGQLVHPNPANAKRHSRDRGAAVLCHTLRAPSTPLALVAQAAHRLDE